MSSNLLDGISNCPLVGPLGLQLPLLRLQLIGRVQLIGRAKSGTTPSSGSPNLVLSAPFLYPSELASHTASKSPVVIKEDSSKDDFRASGGPDAPTWSYPQPKCPVHPVWSPSPTVDSWLPSADFDMVYAKLRSLTETVTSLQHAAPTPPPGVPPHSRSQPSPVLTSTMSRDKIISLLGWDGSSLPSVHPCNMTNNTDTKTRWTAEELHHAMGCRKFRNYKTLLQVSHHGEWIDDGEFPPALGSFATITKAKHGLPQTKQNISILMPFIWTLHLVTVFLSVVLNMHLSSSIAQTNTIGRSA
jgi:hypothetical protein